MGHNTSPADKDGLDLTFVNTRTLCNPNEGHERGRVAESAAPRPPLPFLERMN